MDVAEALGPVTGGPAPRPGALSADALQLLQAQVARIAVTQRPRAGEVLRLRAVPFGPTAMALILGDAEDLMWLGGQQQDPASPGRPALPWWPEVTGGPAPRTEYLAGDVADPGRALLLADLAAMAHAHGGDPEIDLPLDLIALTVLRHWAQWLRGFGAASIPYLLATFVRRPGVVAATDDGTVRVALSRAAARRRPGGVGGPGLLRAPVAVGAGAGRAGTASRVHDGGVMPAGYASSLEHLADELARADQLVRAQVERWRQSIAQTKPDQAWGMAYVDDAEVGRYLKAPFRLAGQDAAAEARAVSYRQAAQDRARHIAARRQATTDDVPLRLDLLVRRFGLDDTERDLLLLCLLPELDFRFRRLYGYLHDDVSRGIATVGLLEEMLTPPFAAAGCSARTPAWSRTSWSCSAPGPQPRARPGARCGSRTGWWTS